MAPQATTDGGENSTEQTFAAIEGRFDDAEGNVEVTSDELVSLGVLSDYGHGDREKLQVDHDGPVMVSGTHDTDPVRYYLVRIAHDQWLALKHLHSLIDSDPKWYVTGIGDISVEGVPLDDSFDGDLDVDDDTLADIREAYIREAEETFDFVDELWGAAFDGRRVHMELEEPWLGLERVADHLGIDDVWEYDIRPAIARARPSNPRVLDTSLTTEFAVDVRFER